ncbi:MAG TPA: hypothetical protein VKV25_06575, partial [Acidimicrobiales bacterium]|nr:hypothetical protein [Acidimicrobiales bacterium]
MSEVLRTLGGGGIAGVDEERPAAAPAAPVLEEPAEPLLQASWADGRIVVWAGAAGGPPGTVEVLEKLLASADAGAIGWERHSPVSLPGGGAAEARSAPVAQTLGWLVGIG